MATPPAFLNTGLTSDVQVIQGGTTTEGIHCGVMAGTIEILFKGFAGINLFTDHLEFSPSLPAHWQELGFSLQHRG